MSKLNSKASQYKACYLLQKDHIMHNGILFFPLLQCKPTCAKSHYGDRMQFQINIYIDKQGKLTVDNMDIREATYNHPDFLSTFLPDIKKNCTDLFQIYDNECMLHIDAFLLYMEDATTNQAHCNSMLVITDKCSMKMCVFIFDPLGHSKDDNIDWWTILTQKGIKKMLDTYLRSLLNLKKEKKIHWYLPSDDLMSRLYPQRQYELNIKRKNKSKYIGFCSAWSIFFIHYIVSKIAYDLRFVSDNHYIGLAACINHIYDMGTLLESTNDKTLIALISSYSTELQQVIDSYGCHNECLPTNIKSKANNRLKDILNNCIKMLFS